MAIEDPRTVRRDKQDEKHTVHKREDAERDEDRWDSQDDSDYRYTDWASI